VLADGGVLVVGACDGGPDTGCLIRTNPESGNLRQPGDRRTGPH
jgi:hypothetical protein